MEKQRSEKETNSLRKFLHRINVEARNASTQSSSFGGMRVSADEAGCSSPLEKIRTLIEPVKPVNSLFS